MYTKPPKLTARLAAVAGLVPPGSTVADIGTDHAYLPIWLTMSGRCPRAVASDIKEGPVRRAADMVGRYGQAGRIVIRQGTGLAPVAAGEADCIVIAGMGGLVIAEILKQGEQVLKGARQIILQPMTAVPELRAFLCQNGYRIQQELLAQEDEKLYHILSVSQDGPAEQYTDFECYMGKLLLAKGAAHRRAYLEKQQCRLRRMLSGLQHTHGSAAAEKEARVRGYLAQIAALLDADAGVREP